MAGWIKMPLSMEVGLSPGDFMLYGDPDPLPKKGAEPPPLKFSAYVYCGKTAGSRWHLARRQASAQGTLCSMGTQPPPNKGGGAQFSAHVYCGHGRPFAVGINSD